MLKLSEALPRIDHFEANPLGPHIFQFPINMLHIDNHHYENVILEAVYDQHLSLSLKFKTHDAIHELMFSEMKIRLADRHIKQSDNFFATNVIINSKQGTEMSFIPDKEPFFIEFKTNTYKVECLIINGPDLFFGKIELLFEHGDFKIHIRSMKETFNLFQNRRIHKYDRLFTHIVTLTRKSGKLITSTDAFSELTQLGNFITFVRGKYSAVGQ